MGETFFIFLTINNGASRAIYNIIVITNAHFEIEKIKVSKVVYFDKWPVKVSNMPVFSNISSMPAARAPVARKCPVIAKKPLKDAASNLHAWKKNKE